MNTYDGPGEGWRLQRHGEPLRGPYVHVGNDEDDEGVFWVREKPVPPLPTEDGTVIKVTWLNEYVDRLMFNGANWSAHAVGAWHATELPALITGFEVLAEPSEQRFSERALRKAITEEVRRETAKAVLDRVRERIGRGAHAWFVDDIAREFGVTE